MMTQRSHAEISRHEAAHFVMGWAIDSPDFYVETRMCRECRNDESQAICGETSGCCGCPSPFEHILKFLAGPVADYWDCTDEEMLERNKEKIDCVLSSIEDGYGLHPDDGDWDALVRYLCFCGVDVSDSAQRKSALLFFIDAARTILKTCEREWRETTEYLIEHDRIGFVGNYKDQGQGAGAFFDRWSDEDGDIPQVVRECVAEFRKACNARYTLTLS